MEWFSNTTSNKQYIWVFYHCCVGIVFLWEPSWLTIQEFIFSKGRSSRPKMFCKKGVLRNITKFAGKHLYQSLIFNKVAGFKNETLAQVFSCKFCKISKNAFFHRAPLVAASRYKVNIWFAIKSTHAFSKCNFVIDKIHDYFLWQFSFLNHFLRKRFPKYKGLLFFYF